MGINSCRGRAWGPLLIGAVCVAAFLLAQGCRTVPTSRGASPSVGGSQPWDVDVRKPAPGQGGQVGKATDKSGGQPIMPMSKGLASPGDRVTVVVVVPPFTDDTFVKVTPIAKGLPAEQKPFETFGSIRYLDKEYDKEKGMKIPANTGCFCFDLVMKGSFENELEVGGAVSYEFDLDVETTTSKFGLVVVNTPQGTPK